MKNKKRCKWTYDEWHDYYVTACGNGFVLTGGTFKENELKYCCFCGKEIEVK